MLFDDDDVVHLCLNALLYFSLRKSAFRKRESDGRVSTSSISREVDIITYRTRSCLCSFRIARWSKTYGKLIRLVRAALRSPTA